MLSLPGCAKFPDSGSNLFTKRLVIKMRLDGAVRWGQTVGQQPYIYMVPLRLSTEDNPTDLGPIPVTTFGGNGFVAGNCTHFVLYNPSSANPFEIWRFRDTALNDRILTGYAINYVDPRDTRNAPDTLQFEIDLSQLVPEAEVPTIRSVQANFFSMDRLALDTNGHRWDSLGDSRQTSQFNTFLQFQLRNSRTISNTTTQLEPPSMDVNGANEPDLNIDDWSIEVRLQQ